MVSTVLNEMPVPAFTPSGFLPEFSRGIFPRSALKGAMAPGESVKQTRGNFKKRRLVV